MKYLILVVFVLLVGNCIGQKKDSLIVHQVFLDEGHTTWYTQVDLPKDTVRVLMLVCDTSLQSYKNIINGNTMSMYDDKVWWQFGYEVREPINNMLWFNDMEISYTISGFPYVKTYLDQNKKKLNQSIVVWITKEIK